MSFYFRNYRFAPRWYFVVGTVVLCALFIRLGFWQLGRAETKKHLQNIFAERLHLAAQPLKQVLENKDIRYYPIQVRGHYDNAHTFLLDNKIHDHQVGYEVLTPFILNDHQQHNQQTILVNRGWVLADTNRHVLPVIQAVTGDQTLVGNVYVTPGKSFTLGSALEKKEIWPLRIEALDISAIQNKLKKPVYPFVLLLSADQSGGFVRDWQPVTMPASKNIGYAVQWFSFAALLIILFFALNIRKNK